jgi:hypothetical protein
MQVHALGIGRRRDHRGAHAARGADRAKQVCGVVAVVSYHRRPRADGSLALPFHPASPDGTFGKSRPNVCMCALLSNAGFLLKPDLDRGFGGGAEQGFFQDRTEVS